MEGLKCLRRWLSLFCLALELNVRPSPPLPPPLIFLLVTLVRHQFRWMSQDAWQSTNQKSALVDFSPSLTIFWPDLISLRPDISYSFVAYFKTPARKGGNFIYPMMLRRYFLSCFSPRWKERSSVSREIFNDLNFKMQLIQGKFQWALLIFDIWLIMQNVSMVMSHIIALVYDPV